MKNNPVFCSAPWQATYYKESRKQYKMCCSFDTWTNAHSPVDYYNSDINQEVRNSILQGKWHPGCRVCQEQELAGGHSDRSSFNWSFDIQNNPVDVNRFNLKWLDYRPGNLCNLKCRMCDAGNSSLIEKEMNEYPELEKFLPRAKGMNMTELDPAVVNEDIFRNLEFLKILGGEPTIDPQVYKLLEWTVEKDFAKNVELRYTTNATNVNERWTSSVNQFKTTRIQLSLDGSGPTYDYIRTPAHWDKVKENILSIQHKIHNIRGMGINMVFSLYNCFTVDEWYPELEELANKCFDKEPLRIHIIECTSPDYLMVRNLPQQYKDIIRAKLDSLPENSTTQAMKHFTELSMDNSNQNLRTFFEYNDTLDKIRKTDINSISPIYEELRRETFAV